MIHVFNEAVNWASISIRAPGIVIFRSTAAQTISTAYTASIMAPLWKNNLELSWMTV